MTPPTLLVISGLPAAGKTVLGTKLSTELGWPLISKDEYKELLHHALTELTSAQSGPLSFELTYHVAGVVLRAGQSCVIETHFYRGTSEAKLTALATQHGAALKQVFCHAPLEVLRARHLERVARGDHPFIHQASLLSQLRASPPAHLCAQPLALPGPVLWVDTTAPCSPREVAAWVSGA